MPQEVIVKFLSQTSLNYAYIFLTEWEFFDVDGVKIPILSAAGYSDNGHSPVSTDNGSDWQKISNLWDGNLAGDNFWYADKPNGNSIKFVLADDSVPHTYSWLTSTGHALWEQYAAFPVTWEITHDGITNHQTNPISLYSQVPNGTQVTMGPFFVPQNILPVITIIGSSIVYVVKDDVYADAGATAVDAEDVDISLSVSVNSTVNTSDLGTYTVTYSVTASNGETATTNRTVCVVTEIPTPTCFPAGTPIQTDQGVTAIEQLVPGEHTLRGKSILAITQTRPLQKHIVCFEKDSIGKNVPSQQTLCSKEHKVLYQGEMIKARDLADMCKNVKKVSYNGDTLYNVLLEKHGKMLVNNMICETLHPENIAAKFAKSKNTTKKNVLLK